MPRQLFLSPLWSAIEPRSLAWLSALCSWSEAVSAFVLLRADLFWGASSTSWLFSLIYTAQDPISSLLSHAHIHTPPKPLLLSLQQAPPSPQATPPPATTPTTTPTTTSESFFFFSYYLIAPLPASPLRLLSGSPQIPFSAWRAETPTSEAPSARCVLAANWLSTWGSLSVEALDFLAGEGRRGEKDPESSKEPSLPSPTSTPPS